jgi:hypothetical protein
MKYIILIFLSITLISCENEQNNSSPISGVWNRIGNVKFIDGKPVDTIFFGDGKIGKNKGRMIKSYSNENFVWFRYNDKLDSLGINVGQETAVQGKYEVKNDTLFEYILNVDDKTKVRWADWMNRINSTYTAKIIYGGDQYIQFNLSNDGTGNGELWSRADSFTKNKNPLVGAYTIKNEIKFENFQPKDTTVWRENDKTSIWFSIFSDNYRTTFFQRIRLDSLGNDNWNGSGLLVKYEYSNNTLNEKFDFGTKQPQQSFKGRNSSRETKLDLSSETGFTYKIFGPDRLNGNGTAVFFTRIE